MAPGRPLCRGYRALRRLRRGHAVDVYDAWSEERGCRCIAKIVRPDRAADRESRASLFLEGRLLLGLSHPHLVRAYELVRGPRPVLALETLTGATVSKLIADHPRGFPARDVLYLGIHLCSALGYLHRTGYLHLDVKPSNIVSQASAAKLIDLSLAAPAGRRLRGSAGTPGYMAPEQVERLSLTPATDVFGLGCVLHEAARGQAAFRPRPGAWRFVEPPSLVRASRLPRQAAEAVDACLSRDPSARPSLAELSDVLRAAV